MAAADFSDWVPEEYDSAVIQRVNAVSAVEFFGSHTPMTTDTKSVPRSAGMAVAFIAKSGAYGEDASANDEVVLSAKKLGEAIRIAEEDLNDSLADILAAKGVDWATSYGKLFDNATLAVTAAAGATVPYTSVYKALATANADTGYTANSNLTLAGSAGITYDTLSAGLGKLEDSDYFDPERVVVIAHPTFRGGLRSVKDSQGHPIFVQGLAGTPDTLFGHEIKWATGAKTSALPTPSPTGHPLLVFVNRDFMLIGDRSNPESKFIDADGAGALTDEAIMKFRARKGFAVGHEKAFSIVEKDQ